MESSNTRRVLCAGVLLAALTATGCASLPPPRELDLRQMRIVAVDTPPRVDINGLRGKAVGAGVGAVTGTGAGVLLGAMACAGTGLFFPLCALTLVPTGLAVGAVTGGVVGAVRTESTDAIGLKARALRDHLAGTLYQRTLALRLQEELQEALADEAPSRPGAPDAQSGGLAPWTLDVSITELATEGKSEFALRLVARIAVRRSGEVDPVWSVAKEVQSETELTTTAWAADQGHAMQVVLDRCIRSAAHQLRIDLTRPFDASAASSHPRSRYSNSCNDVPADVTAPTATPSLCRDQIEPTSSVSATADPAITKEAT